MRTILQDIPDDSDNDTCTITIFLDSEWNIETSQHGYVTGWGQTAVVQIAYKNMIYILQLGAMLAGGRISPVLAQVLENPRVLKAGRAVSGDLKYLEQATHPSRPFVGAVDLAKMAKDRLVTTNAKIGLADLCAVTLGLRLDKHVTERVSSSWENEELSQSQIRYAALDVYTSSRIHEFLSSIPIPVVLPKTVEVGTPVLLFNDDCTRLIARGSIERLEGLFNMGNIRPDGTPDIINISPSRCLVQISDIVVPAAVLKVHNKTPLSSFGSVPFSAVCLRNHLRLASPLPFLQFHLLPSRRNPEQLNLQVRLWLRDPQIYSTPPVCSQSHPK
ncbi:ribonuclease H-like domain-containing protein [Mycena sp. CBHHK59/15]|nr:ribonuclease H-like domain-containing protein [Mycena sp. CBHHK59/15]